MWWCSCTQISATVSKVLEDDDLLIEILLRVGFPTTLVRAALVCRRWFRHISDHAFLRRFRELHPPCLLGFYVNPDRVGELPRFVPMLPQPLELASVIRRASSSFDGYRRDGASTRIMDCRNGTVLMKHHDGTLGVHNLLCPERGMVVFPTFPSHEFKKFFSNIRQMLSKEEEGRLSYFCLSILCGTAIEPTMLVYRLQDGVWCMHNLPIEQVAHPRDGPKSVLVANKIYMAAAWSGIIVLDLTTSNFSTIPLPLGVEHGDKSTILSRVDDAASVYLIHVKQQTLRIWLYNNDDWLLVDTICLQEMCASLTMLDCNASLQINQAGDNAEFVFLDMGRWAIYLDIKCRTPHKVYEIPCMDPWRSLHDIYPFMMIWQPTFPALKVDPARFSSLTLDDLYIYSAIVDVTNVCNMSRVNRLFYIAV